MTPATVQPAVVSTTLRAQSPVQLMQCAAFEPLANQLDWATFASCQLPITTIFSINKQSWHETGEAVCTTCTWCTVHSVLSARKLLT
jgi:hypothetical protein